MGEKLFKKIKHPDQLKKNDKTKNIMTLDNKQNVLQNVPLGTNSNKVESPFERKMVKDDKDLKNSKILGNENDDNDNDEVTDVTHNKKECKRIIEKTNSNKSVDNNNSNNNSNKSVNSKCHNKNNVTPFISGNNRCCSHYCQSYMQALKGSRRVVECSEDGNSYACLSIPGNQTVTYTFTLTIPENVLSSLPPTDPSICVENVRIILRTAIKSKVDSTDLGSKTDEELQSDKKNQKEIQDHVEVEVEVEGKEYGNGIGNKNENINEKRGNDNINDKNEISTVFLKNEINMEIDKTAVVCDDSFSEYREVILEISPLSGEFRKALQDRSVSKKDGKEKEKNGAESSSTSGTYFLLFKNCFNFCIFFSVVKIIFAITVVITIIIIMIITIFIIIISTVVITVIFVLIYFCLHVM